MGHRNKLFILMLAFYTSRAGSEPIATQCNVRPDIGSIRRILGTRFGFVDNGKHEYLVKVDGKDELVWLQEAHAGEFRQLIDAYKKETREPHLRRKIGFEYFVGRDADAPRRSDRWSRNRSESRMDPLIFGAYHAAEWSAADGINENYTPPPVEMLRTSVAGEQPSRTPTEPPVNSMSTVAPQYLSLNKNRLVMAKEVKAPKETQSKLDGPAVRQPDAEVRRTGESGTQAKSSTKKRLNVAVVGVEHIRLADVPEPTADIANGIAGKRAQISGDAMDRLAQDICSVGNKKAKMGESEQDRHIRLFHAARQAHNLHADRSFRCEKLIEFIVDESFIGREQQDRKELYERLLEMCMQGVLLEDIACDDPQKKRVLKSYSKRLQVWKVTCELFPDLVEDFAAQPEVQSPLDALTEDAFKKINEYLSELKAAMHSMPKALKEAVVWQLLGSAGHSYDRCTEGIHKRVAELIRKNIP